MKLKLNIRSNVFGGLCVTQYLAYNRQNKVIPVIPGKISTKFSLDDSPLLDQRYSNPMCFLQRYTFVMYFIQRLKPQWGEWGIKR